jgi:hypothetical protein
MKTRIYPSVANMTSEIKDDRKGKNKVAIVIASNKGNSILEEHLKYLESQTFKEFDVVIVYGTDDEFLATPKWASMVHIRRNPGVALDAAFYIGERYFLENGYDMFMEADNYSFPKSRDIMEKLVSAIRAGSEYAYPKIQFEHTKIVSVTTAMRQYACVSRSLAERVGLVYAPFEAYLGDVEYTRRLLRGARKHENVDSILYRSYKPKGALIFPNAYSYHKVKNSTILIRRYDRGISKIPMLFLNFFQNFYIALFHLVSGNTKSFLEINSGIFTGAAFSMKPREVSYVPKPADTVKEADFELVFADYAIKDFYESEKKELAKFSSRFSHVFFRRDWALDYKKSVLPAMKIFGKKVCFFIYFGNYFLYTLIPFFSKKIYIYGDGVLSIAKDRDSARYRAAFFLFIPLALTASFVLFLAAAFNPRKIDTYRYGIDEYIIGHNNLE